MARINLTLTFLMYPNGVVVTCPEKSCSAANS